LFRRKRIVAPHQHIAHHIEHRIALARDLDAEVHLANLRQSILPLRFLQITRVVRFELLEHIRATPLHSQQQQTKEVEQRQRRVNADVGGRGRYTLHA
jgi:hypothetical protein